MRKETSPSLFDHPDSSAREILDTCAAQPGLDPQVRYARTVYAYYDSLADPANPTMTSEAAFAAARYATRAGHNDSAVRMWLHLAHSSLRQSEAQSVTMNGLQRSLAQDEPVSHPDTLAIN